MAATFAEASAWREKGHRSVSFRQEKYFFPLLRTAAFRKLYVPFHLPVSGTVSSDSLLNKSVTRRSHQHRVRGCLFASAEQNSCTSKQNVNRSHRCLPTRKKTLRAPQREKNNCQQHRTAAQVRVPERLFPKNVGIHQAKQVQEVLASRRSHLVFFSVVF